MNKQVMGKITKNYMYNLAYQLLVLITPIITAPYLARVLGAKNLGIYSYVNSSGNIITTIALLGIYAYGNRQIAYVRDNKTELTKTFWEILYTRVLLGITGTIVYYIYALINSKFTAYFVLYYPYILAQFLDCSWVFIGLEDMRPAVMKNFFTRLLNVIGIFLFIKDKEDVWIYILLLAITLFFANLSIYTQLPKYIGKPSGSPKKIWEHIKGSFNLFLPQVASLFYLQVDKVMIGWLSQSTEQVSFYDQAEKIVTIPLSFITVISSVVMPRLANEYRKNNREVIQNILIKAGKYAICLAMPMMLGILCISQQFIPWYLGKEFEATSIAIMVLTPIIFFNALTGISGNQYFTATNQISILLKAYVTAAVMNVVINALLIPRFGYIGAAVTTVISSFSSVVTQYYCLTKQVQVKQLWRYTLKYLIGAILMAVSIRMFSFQMKASAITTFAQIFMGAAIYLIYLILTKDSIVREIASKLRFLLRKV